MMLHIVREPGDLVVLVRRRNRYEDGLVKAAADQLDLAIFYQGF